MKSWIPLVLALLTGGGFTPPVSMPPLPADDRLLSVADDDCLMFLSLSGCAEPDAQSQNQTEQLIEVITTAAARDAGKNPAMLPAVEALTYLVRGTFTRPAVLFFDRINLGPPAPIVRGGLVVNAGDGAEEAEKMMQQLFFTFTRLQHPVRREVAGSTGYRFLPMPPQVPPVSWSRVGKYIVLAFGVEMPGLITARLTRAEVPLNRKVAALKKRMPVERPSIMFHLDVENLFEAVGGMAGPRGNQIFSFIGLNTLRSVESIVGLEGRGIKSKVLVRPIREFGGILGALGQTPLMPEALAHLPGDSDICVASSLNLKELWEWLNQNLGNLDPRALEEIKKGMLEAERELGFHPVDDLMPYIGTTWTLHNAPSDGGLIVSGITATVSIKNQQAVSSLVDGIGRKLEAELNDNNQVALKRQAYRGHTVYFVSPIREQLPVSPSWAVTQKSFVLAAYPQMVKAHIDRVLDGNENHLLNAAQLTGLFNREKGINYLSRLDMKPLLEKLYPLLYPIWCLACSDAQRNGLPLDPSILPRASSVLPHMDRTLTYSKRDKDGFYIEEDGTFPIGGILSPSNLAMAAGIIMPAMQKARSNAERLTTMNRLRQIGLALHNYRDAHAKFPDTLKDLNKFLDGKQILQDEQGRTFVYYGKGLKSGKINMSQTPVCATSRPKRGRRTVLFADGHVEYLREPQFQNRIQNLPAAGNEGDAAPQVRPEDADLIPPDKKLQEL
jgi:prepilin-type processing-associated H-X9-DG protein